MSEQLRVKEGPEITVGPSQADVVGCDDVAIQAALTLARSRGVRRVRILKGTYLCRNSIFLHSGLTLMGEGDATVLRKPPPVESLITRDVSHYERAVPVKEPEKFPVGCGVQLHGINNWSKAAERAQHTVAAKNGNELTVAKDYVGKNFWPQAGEAKVSTHIPLITGDGLTDITVAHMQLDGAIPREALTYTTGAGLYLWNCRNVTVRDLYVHNNSGDGIGFEICHDVTVEGCRLEANGLPLHAGSGSLRMIVRGNRILNNPRGFYFCWGIQQGLLEDNEIADNDTYGVSIGFHDSHNIIRRNRILRNKQVGVEFRGAHYPDQSPRDDLLEANVIADNGPKDSPLGVRLDYHAEDIRIASNILSDTRGSSAGVGIRIEKTVRKVVLERNRITGFGTEVLDNRNQVS